MFQLTLPVRGATSFHRLVILSERFNSRSPCGERLVCLILIVALYGFNSRSPCGERRAVFYVVGISGVSTHAPRAGSDKPLSAHQIRGYVSTHAPRVGSDLFCILLRVGKERVSTHAPRVGSDSKSLIIFRTISFQHTLPEWGATSLRASASSSWLFQLTRPEWGATG